MNPEEAIAFVRKHGVVLASARGPVPGLAEAVAGEPIWGSWWSHSRSHQIFDAFRTVAESKDILVCRLINGNLTFVHRRLWPAIVRLAKRFPLERIAQVHEEHTPSGRHVVREIPYPEWVPAETAVLARKLTEPKALRALGAWAAPSKPPARRTIEKARHV